MADHADRAELVAGVTMRPVELVVDGTTRWVWTRSDVPAMDVDDLLTLFRDFGSPAPEAAPQRNVVDGGTAARPEAVSLFPDPPAGATASTERPAPVKRQPPPAVVVPTPPVSPASRLVPSVGPTW